MNNCEACLDKQKKIAALIIENKLSERFITQIQADKFKMLEEIEKLQSEFETLVVEYEQEIERLQNYVIVGYEQGIKELKEENAKLRECVEFYADQSSWMGWHRDVDSMPRDTEPAKATSDGFDIMLGGKRARQLLKELNEGNKVLVNKTLD